ncbi:hypothetical protein C8J57DRAFT_1257266 [Mycena rebaudengoi]|nr:hypothetical protein C8J57DRAFT_1257266 [Mycena rebaudengoi]
MHLLKSLAMTVFLATSTLAQSIVVDAPRPGANILLTSTNLTVQIERPIYIWLVHLGRTNGNGGYLTCDYAVEGQHWNVYNGSHFLEPLCRNQMQPIHVGTDEASLFQFRDNAEIHHTPVICAAFPKHYEANQKVGSLRASKTPNPLIAQKKRQITDWGPSAGNPIQILSRMGRIPNPMAIPVGAYQLVFQYYPALPIKAIMVAL